jgi:hypothetical protein
MDVAETITALGGPSAVAAAVGEKPKTVGMWGARNRVPGDHLLVFWRLALAAGLSWEPPGADAIRAQLAAPSKAKAA